MKKILLILPLMALLLAAVEPQKRTIFMIGDSTMATKSVSAFPETGWGQVLSAFADNSRLKIDNHAKNGRSTKSFIDEGLWKAVEEKITAGDYVFIEFGHNDEKKDKPALYACAETDYKTNLKKFITETQKKGATPVLFTSIVRRDFDDKGKLNNTHGTYPTAVKEVAKEMNVVVIDLEAETRALVEGLGVENSLKLYLHAAANQYPNRSKEVKDNTHLCREGAIQIAGLAVKCIKKQIPELASYF